MCQSAVPAEENLIRDQRVIGQVLAKSVISSCIRLNHRYGSTIFGIKPEYGSPSRVDTPCNRFRRNDFIMSCTGDLCISPAIVMSKDCLVSHYSALGSVSMMSKYINSPFRYQYKLPNFANLLVLLLFRYHLLQSTDHGRDRCLPGWAFAWQTFFWKNQKYLFRPY